VTILIEVLLQLKGAGHKQISVVQIVVRNGRERRINVGIIQHVLVLIQGRLARFRHLAGCGAVEYRSLLARFSASSSDSPVRPRKGTEEDRTRLLAGVTCK
jgi:hypothetical protein